MKRTILSLAIATVFGLIGVAQAGESTTTRTTPVGSAATTTTPSGSTATAVGSTPAEAARESRREAREEDRGRGEGRRARRASRG